MSVFNEVRTAESCSASFQDVKSDTDFVAYVRYCERKYPFLRSLRVWAADVDMEIRLRMLMKDN